MFTRSIICLTLLVATLSAKTTLINLPQGFLPQSETEYAQYLQAMTGHHVESSSTTENIKSLLERERPSLLTAPEKITILLATLQGTESLSGINVDVEGKQIRQIVDKYSGIFDVKLMLNADGEQLRQEIAKLEGQGSLVSVIISDQKSILSLDRAISRQSTVSSKRRLQEPSAPGPKGTYLIKFFFSVLFILVIVACVGFISQNDGKKDTLLYAKFIADVGGR